LPVLVFADWAEERGVANPPLLRWYAREVMPAVAAVPAGCPPQHTVGQDRARKTLRPHPNAGILFQLAAVAFCRRPLVWERLPPNPGRQAVTVARLSALGLATPSERKAILKAAIRAGKQAGRRYDDLNRPEVRATFASPALADEAVKLVSHECFSHYLAMLLMNDAGPAVARCVYKFAGNSEIVVAEIGYQKSV
jgi:hypothetical protein